MAKPASRSPNQGLEAKGRSLEKTRHKEGRLQLTNDTSISHLQPLRDVTFHSKRVEMTDQSGFDPCSKAENATASDMADTKARDS